MAGMLRICLTVVFAVTCAAVHAEVLMGKVVAVQDGDSITVLDGQKNQHKVRLWGIDAPELKQAFGNRSKQQLSDFVFGKDVEIERKGKDRYGRTLGIVFVEMYPFCKPGGPCFPIKQDVNNLMIMQGMAWWYQKYAPKAEQYAKAEKFARDTKKGLWVDENPIPPWEWRRKK